MNCYCRFLEDISLSILIFSYVADFITEILVRKMRRFNWSTIPSTATPPARGRGRRGAVAAPVKNSALTMGSKTKLRFLNAQGRSLSGSTVRYRFYTVNYSQMLTNALLLANGEGTSCPKNFEDVI